MCFICLSELYEFPFHHNRVDVALKRSAIGKFDVSNVDYQIVLSLLDNVIFPERRSLTRPTVSVKNIIEIIVATVPHMNFLAQAKQHASAQVHENTSTTR